MSDTQIRIGADVSQAEKELAKLQKKFEEIDKATEKTDGKDLTIQKAKELERLTKAMEKNMSSFGTQHAKVMSKLTQEQERLAKKLEATTKKSARDKITSQLEEKKLQKDMVEQTLKDAKRIYELKKKQANDAIQGASGGNVGSKFLSTLAKGKQSMGLGGAISGLLSGQGFMSGVLGLLGGPIAATIGAVVLGWSALSRKFGKPTMEKNKSSYELFQGNQMFGGDYAAARSYVRGVGRPYNYLTKDSLDTAAALMNNRTIGSKEMLKEELDAIFQYSRATGLDSRDVAARMGKIGSITQTSSKSIMQLAESSALALGMSGRQSEVLDVLEQIAQNSANTNDILSEEHLKGYMEFANELTRKGLDGSQALNKALSASQLIGSNKQMESLYIAEMMKKTGKTDIGSINLFREQVQSNNPEVQKTMVEILSKHLGDRDTAIAFLSQYGSINTAKNAMDMVKAQRISLEGSDRRLQSLAGVYKISNVGVADNFEAMKETGSEGIGDGVNAVNTTFLRPNQYVPASRGGAYVASNKLTEDNNKLLTQIEINTSSQVKEQMKTNSLTALSDEETGKLMESTGNISRLGGLVSITSSGSGSYTNPNTLIQASAGSSGKFTIHNNMDRTMDTREWTADELNQLIDTLVSQHEKRTGKTSALRGTGQAFIDASKRTGMGVEAALAMAMFESDGGTSYQARVKNNFFGWGSYNGASYMAHTFDSPSSGVDSVMSKIAKNYIFSDKNNQTTPYELTFGNNGNGVHKYNVGNEQGWADGVNAHRNRIASTGNELFGEQKIKIEVSGKIEGVTPATEGLLVDTFRDSISNSMMTRGN